MRRIRHAVFAILGSVVLGGPASPAGFEREGEGRESPVFATSLPAAPDADGRVTPRPSGRSDVKGFRMVTAADGSPRFVSGPVPEETPGSGSFTMSDAGAWDEGFAWNSFCNVNVVVVSGTEVYVGGNFAALGGMHVNGIAKWDGSTWSVLREGVNDDVEALALRGYDLFVGGWFLRAGTADSGHLALWHSCPESDAPVVTVPPAGKTILQGQTATLDVTVSGAGPLRYRWYRGISPDTRAPAPGATDAPAYTTPVLTADASYWVRVSSACGVTDSPSATVTVRHGLYAAHAAHSDLWWTRLNLLNPGAADHPVDLNLYDAGGVLRETRTLASLPAGSLFAADLATLFSPAALSPDMWLTAGSLSPLQGVLEFGTRDHLAYVALPMETAGRTGLVFPYVVVLGEWYTGITLVNIGDAPAQLRLGAYREDGLHLGTVDGVLASGAKYARLVNQVFTEVSDPTLIRFVKVTSTQPLVAFELFGNLANPGLAGLPAFDGQQAAVSKGRAPGTMSGEPSPGAFPAVNHSLFFSEIPDNALFYTGVTFSNLGAEGAPASVELLDASGTPVAQGEIFLPPNAQVTREIWDVFDGTPRSDAVSMHATAAAPLTGFELYLSRSGGNAFRFDGIGASSAGSRKMLFPLVNRGTPWTSTLRVLNVAGTPVTVNVRGYDPTGESAGIYTVSLAPGARLDRSPEAMLPSPFYEVAWLSVEGTGELAGDLFMASTDLTRQMWADLKSVQPSLPDDPSSTQYSPGMSYPVQDVTWYATVLFANLLSVERGLTRCYYADAAFATPITSVNDQTDSVYCNWEANGYRLPTEGEWEYFCRAGTMGPFCVDEPNYTLYTCDSLTPNPPLTSLDTVAWWHGNNLGTMSPVYLQLMASVWSAGNEARRGCLLPRIPVAMPCETITLDDPVKSHESGASAACAPHSAGGKNPVASGRRAPMPGDCPFRGRAEGGAHGFVRGPHSRAGA